MKRLTACLVALAAMAGTAAAAPATITILHVNDTHSFLAPWGPRDANLDGTLGGLTKAATVIAAEKARDPAALFVHGGDLFNGDLFFNEYLGVPELLLLQSLGLDVFAIGNHEFQFGPEFLAAVLNATWPSGPGVAVLGTNLDFTGYPALTNWITPTVIKEVNGVKVGFFSLTTPYDAVEQPAPVVIQTDLAGISAAYAAQLRADGAQVVVCVAHLGLPLSRQIAAVPGLDVIINAHDHVALAQPEHVGSTWIVSAGEHYRWVGRLRLSVDDLGHVALVDYALLPVDASTPPHPYVQAVVDALSLGIIARYGDVFHDPIAWAEDEIGDTADPRHAKRDTAIGNLLTDAYREETGTQIALEANGFLDSMPPGTLVPDDVFRAMSYGLPVFDPDAGTLTVQPFHLATFRILGAQLLYGLEIGLLNPDLFAQVSGMRFEYDSTKPPGAQIVPGSVHVGGHKLDPNRLYTVTANQGLVMFLPGLGVEVQDVQILQVTAFDAARDAVERAGVIEPEVSGRIRDVSVHGRDPHGGRCVAMPQARLPLHAMR